MLHEVHLDNHQLFIRSEHFRNPKPVDRLYKSKSSQPLVAIPLIEEAEIVLEDLYRRSVACLPDIPIGAAAEVTLDLYRMID